MFSGTRIRRRILKQAGNEISIPIPRKNQDIKKDIKEKIISGEYDLGVPVLETECTKLVVNSKTGNIEKKTSTLTARKYPFEDIRRKTLTNNKPFLKVKPDEFYHNMKEQDAITELTSLNENVNNDQQPHKQLQQVQRTRHWLIWHDHSDISNNGIMLFLLRELYDPGIHLTNKEFKETNGCEVDVQSIIEQPHLYMMGCSKDTADSQLMFVPTRRECLNNLSKHVELEGVSVIDQMRFMNGDNPSIEFEDGTQKVSLCTLNSSLFIAVLCVTDSDLVHYH